MGGIPLWAHGPSAFSPGIAPLRVRLFSTETIERVQIDVERGRFAVLSQRHGRRKPDTVAVMATGQPGWTLSKESKKIRLRTRGTDRSLGRFEAVHWVPLEPGSRLRLQTKGSPKLHTGVVRFSQGSEGLTVVNEVDLEDYVAGVVQGEAGHVGTAQFLKAQAVLARTFALRNLGKHGDLGYDLKDDVSSQVYMGYPTGRFADSILAAVRATRDTVLLDEQCRPALVVFHANSGGQTVASEWVWGRPIPYLKARPDPFSEQGPSARWVKRVPRDKMHRWLADQFKTEPSNPDLIEAFARFEQPERKERFAWNGKSIPLPTLRHAFGLRSTWFNVRIDGDDYVLNGRGFGHGVGLAQDAAIIMSEKGYNYKTILYFYYGVLELDAWRPTALLP